MRKSGTARSRSSGCCRRWSPERTVKDVCREHGIAENTYYRWKSKYGGMDVNEARRLKELELENRRLKTRGGRADAARAGSEGRPVRENGDARGPARGGEILPGSIRLERARSACRLAGYSRSSYRRRSLR